MLKEGKSSTHGKTPPGANPSAVYGRTYPPRSRTPPDPCHAVELLRKDHGCGNNSARWGLYRSKLCPKGNEYYMDCRRFLCARPLRATLCQPPPCLPKARRTVTDQTGSSGRTTNTPFAGHRDTHTIRNPWASTKQPQQLLAADSRPVGSTFERQHIVIVLHVHRGECATTKTVTTNTAAGKVGRQHREKKIPKNSCTVNKEKKPC